MHRCFAETAAWQADSVVLPPDESAHLVTVLRAKPGDEATVFDGQGRVAPAEVIKASARGTHLRFTGPSEQHPRPSPSITLVQAIPKGGHMDQIVEKATELGTAIILPVLTERTVRRPGESKPDRWLRIAISAAKQCGTPWVPAIRPVQSLRDALSAVRADNGLLLVASLGENSKPVRQVLREATGVRPERVGLLVGPEGDLTADEYRLAGEAGAIPVSFGRLVLRVETAALFGLSVIKYELGG
jgi:16S rRNA (uracil1498-N3)-methyltransferase